jgi:glutathione S-transferase
MKLYMHPVSMTSRPVRLFIAESGIDVDEQVVDLMAGEHYEEPFSAINPNRLVPVLEDGDFRLTEELGDPQVSRRQDRFAGLSQRLEAAR